MTTARGPCPFINLDNERCTKRLSLVNLPQAFSVCLDAHRCCSVYHALRRERDEKRNARRLARSA